MKSSNGYSAPLPSERLHDHFSRLKIGAAVPVNLDVRAYFEEPNAEGLEPWLQKPELPSREEILGIDDTNNEVIELAPNRVAGPWISKSAYLKAHYELLREDAIAPLRDAVAFVREDPDMADSQIVAIYEKVYIVGITFAHKGLAFRIRFSASRAGKNIAWEYSSRLRTGSIVALSPARDSFKNKCVVAVVAARPLEGVKQHPPEIDILFARPEDADFDPQKEWIMVQAKNGYYESVRHTMKALQKMSREKFPLAEQICFLEPNVNAPSYVEESPIVDMQTAVDASGEEVQFDILGEWPETSTGELDATQWKALQHMLTKRLSIIQGPPGTGKTFVSVVALRVMLANMKPNDPPIIVASQTNHALDQILKYISIFEKQYIRVGSRSSDLEIKRRTLYSIRQNQPPANLQGGLLGPSRKNLRNMIQPIIELLQPFNIENADRPLPSSLFVKLGLLSREQSDALAQGAKGWIRSDQKDDLDPLVAWLGERVVKLEVNYSTESFGFVEDEVDLEYEQLKELEAEQGIDDDDYETLKGQFVFLKEGFCGHISSNLSDAACQRYLKSHDLWKVPVRARGMVYNALRKAAKIKLLQVFRTLVAAYTDNARALQIGKFERDANILQSARVIGVTATGLSKYRGLLSTVNPKVVLIEEAAEAIEAPIASACFESAQQLILVGDHQQLKGHCSVQDLEGNPFFLDISMFERLLHNGLEYVTLRRQRRMAPEIRELLEPIYGDLKDHPSVQDRPGIPGMGDVRSYFFSHKWPESSDSLGSKFNEMEAKMIVGFFVHLVLCGTRVEDITILTFYNGQRKKLLRLLRSNSYLQGHYMNVVTVDSYQGEENEIVLLSLVRSGKSGVGFLSIDNRVCVALSRAKRGFYLFGNAMSLACADPLWWKVINIMGTAQPRRLGFYLPLTCVKHGKKTFIQEPPEWDRMNGGCNLECDELLDCGHTRALRCHNFSHNRVVCDRPCERSLPCGHPCGQPCLATHTCSCECPKESARPAAETTRPVAPPIANHSRRVVDVDSYRKEAVRRYHEFANGGAQELDEQLLRLAESTMGTKAPSKPPINLMDDSD